MIQIAAPQENKMGIMPVNKLLLSMSLPMMISMLVQALYNIVDSIFVAKVSEEALTAVSLAFPIQSLIIAVGVGTGVGINAVLSRALGEKDYDKADKIANNGVFLAVLGYFVFVLIGIFLSGPFYRTQTNNPEIVNAGISYLSICMICSLGLFLQITFERLLQSTGKTFYTMITQGTGAIINIILDPIMIFGLCGFPKMGVMGAAIATVIGQTVAAILAIVFNLKLNSEIHLRLKGFRPDRKVIAHIYEVGIPSIIMQAVGSIMVYGMNRILITFSATATAVFGVYFKLQSFVFMPVFGLNNGLVPIVAYNLGAGKKDRLIKAIQLCAVYAISIMLLGFLVFQGAAWWLLHLFNASAMMESIGVPALRIISIGFVFAGFSIIACSVFQSLGNGFYSMLISIIRQLIVLLPAAYVLAKFRGLAYVWWACPIAEIVAAVGSAIFLYHIYHKVIQHIRFIH
ncbi:MAG: MATE family efflux transporter [Lachnospiraceae bacterium]